LAGLHAAERKVILEILCDTKQNLPDYFRHTTTSDSEVPAASKR
jgi:hypothetical protein